MSLKRFMGLPSSLPQDVLNKIMHSTVATCSESAERNARKVVQRFGDNVLAQQQQAENTENHFEAICFKVFPIKFK
jgi:hypothetical protein